MHCCVIHTLSVTCKMWFPQHVTLPHQPMQFNVLNRRRRGYRCFLAEAAHSVGFALKPVGSCSGKWMGFPMQVTTNLLLSKPKAKLGKLLKSGKVLSYDSCHCSMTWPSPSFRIFGTRCLVWVSTAFPKTELVA